MTAGLFASWIVTGPPLTRTGLAGNLIYSTGGNVLYELSLPAGERREIYRAPGLAHTIEYIASVDRQHVIFDECELQSACMLSSK